ncbi:MAG: tetratricopeptide repeat protein [Candidatus Udaeobacter sp.]
MPNDSTPFVGPRPFKREDAPVFFGRTDEADELLSLVVADREVLLYAQSGAGKTSLLNAGLTPLLEKEGFEVLPVARVRYESREEIETQRIANVYIFNVLAGWSALVHQVNNLESMTLADFLDKLPPQLDKEGLPRPRLLIFDQFEELFTFYPERANDRQGFFEQVRDALGKNRLLRVIFAMREEYIAEMTPYAAILPEKLRTRFRLERLREPAALQAVTGPLTQSRFSFAPGVAEKVVQDLLFVNVGNETHAVRGDYVEPVQLQVVCDALCRHLPRNVSVVTQDHLRDFGNVNEALANFYKECLRKTTRTTHVRRGRLRKWFERTLITPEGVRDTVRQGATKTGGLPNRAVRKLEEFHLIRGEERPGRGRWYELIHDTFIRPIQEVNRIADRRKHLLQSIIAGVGVVILVATCITLYQNNRRYQKVSAFMARGAQLAKDGKDADAAQQFEQALQIDPLNREAHVQAAASYALAAHYDQATSHYQEALKIKPDVSAHVALGKLYLWCADQPAKPDDDAVFFDKAEAEIDEASKLDPASSEPDAGCGDIEVRREQKRNGREYFDGETSYREAIRKKPNSRDAYTGLAYVHLYRGEADDAIRDAQKGVDLGSEQATSHTVLGEAFFWKGDYDRAAAEYNRAIGLISTKAAAGFKGAFEFNDAKYTSHNRLGDVYYMKGKYELAKIEYDQALKLAKSWNYTAWMAEASSSLGYVALKESKWGVAADRFRDALKWDSNNSNVHFAIGLLFALLDKPQDAKTHWNKALELRDGSDPLERMERVVCKVALGTPGSVDEMTSIIGERPPIGMMHVAFDDADSLVTFKIHLTESEKIRKMLFEAIEEALKQPAPEE